MPDYDEIRTLADILPLRARLTPDKAAVQELDQDGRLVETTYAGLLARAERYAACLCDEGLQAGQSVAVVMPNSSRWVCAYFGILRAGGVAVPLGHDMPASDPETFAFALDHSAARRVICEEADEERIRPLAGRNVAVVTAESAEAASPAAPAPQQQSRPEDLAQILYTSGTTGPRKGVELTHDNIVFNALQCCRRFGVLPDECLPAVLPFHHAYPLTTTVVLPPFAGARMAVGDITHRRCRDLIRMSRPTLFIAVPRVFESILQGIRRQAEREGRLGRLERAMRLSGRVKQLTGVNVGKLLFRGLHEDLFGGGQLRFCVSGGARISPATLRDYFRLGIPMIQGWGMSELSPVAAVQTFRRARFYFTRYYEKKAGSIGTPLDETEVDLAPGAGAAAAGPAGDAGEMVVRGRHVMRGYRGDAALTEQQVGDLGLSTGDIARRDRDGDLQIVGRTKHVIVLASGKKVFPEADLEDALAGCPAIGESAVRPVADREGAEQIGIIVRPNVEELRRRGCGTLAQLYAAIKGDIDEALKGKPGHVRRYMLSLTEWRDGEYAELAKTPLGKAAPLRNPFDEARSYAALKDSGEPAPWD
jgi:long-chain acyl-CoA synthetase